MIPFSVIKDLNEIHYRHMQELTDKLTEHLDKITELVLKPTATGPVWDGLPWVSEDEEDAEFIAKQERLAAETLAELGFTSGDIRVE